jgi:hypothetical protein
VTIVVTDAFGEVDDDEVTITIVDATPPEITCSLVPIEVESENGTFRVEFSAVDLSDPAPILEAVIVCDNVIVTVANGQTVNLELDNEVVELKLDKQTGILEVKGSNPHLVVTATDANDNTGKCTAYPAFISN